MKFNLEKHLIRPRDSVRERKLAQELRKHPEHERFEFIHEYLQHDPVVGLTLASACLRSKVYFERLLHMALDRADASSIQFWLEAVVPRLGMRRVSSLLEERLNTQGSAVEMALYWLPKFLQPGDEKANAAIEKFRKRVRELGLL